MKTMFSLLLVAGILVAGCSSRQAYPIPAYTPGDEALTCSELKAEMAQIEADIQARTPDANKGLGCVLLAVDGVIRLFIDPENPDEIELEAFQQRLESLRLIVLKTHLPLPSQVEGLRKLGDWMDVNKPALYASQPAPFVAGGVDVSEAGSIRFTMKGNLLYAIDTAEPTAPHVIPGVKPIKDSEIRMLGSGKNLPWHLQGNKLVIEEIPDPLPCDYAWSFKIQVL